MIYLFKGTIPVDPKGLLKMPRPIKLWN